MSEAAWRRISPPAPTRVPDARPAPLYGLAAFLVVVTVVVGVVVYSYVHLALNSDRWPPPGVPAPAWPQPSAAAVLAVLAALAASRAFAHAAHRDDARATARSLVATVLAGSGAAALVARWSAIEPFAVDDHAYAAIVTAASGLAVVLLGVGVLAAAVVTVWVVRGHAGTGVADAPRVVRAYWRAACVLTVALLALSVLGGRAW